MAHFPATSYFVPTDYPHRPRPAQFARGLGVSPGWYQDGRKLRNVKKSAKAFIWPKDGRNGSTWGRVKDILTGNGPDVFVAFGANKSDCVGNRPSRAQWSGHVNLDDTGLAKGFNHEKFAPWTVKWPGARPPGMCYDFHTRKYGPERTRMWTDAIWQKEPHKNRKLNPYPEAFRDIDGLWHQDVQYLPQWKGGPVSNEVGRGMLGVHLPARYVRLVPRY